MWKIYRYLFEIYSYVTQPQKYKWVGYRNFEDWIFVKANKENILNKVLKLQKNITVYSSM